MHVTEFCNAIGLSHDAKILIVEFPLSQDDIKQYYRLFNKNISSFFSTIKNKKNWYEWFLVLYTHFALLLQEEYNSKSISKKIYIDTFTDIAIWEIDFFSKTGRHGLQEFEWLCSSLQMNLFRLSRLQFEPITNIELLPSELAFMKNDIIFNVHIPAKEPLSSQQVQKSYKQALSFWDVPHANFVCFSWLLSPSMHHILPDNSNILTFQKQYQIVLEDFANKQPEERIFGYSSSVVEEYHETTSLQRNAKQWLLNGGSLSTAWGWFIL